MGYRYVTPDQALVMGEGALESLSSELKVRGIQRISLVSSPTAARSLAMERTQQQFDGVDVTSALLDVVQHAPISATEQFAEEIRSSPPDAFIAVGGGSAGDTAKALAILLSEGGPLEDRCSTFTPPNHFQHVDLPAPKIPVIVVATTLSGAEVTPGGGATNQHGVKRVFWDPKVAARVVFFDTESLSAVPRDILLTTGMNGLAHCAEALYSRTGSPISSALAREGARRLTSGLLGLAMDEPPPPQMWEDLEMGAAIGGMVISNARVGVHHAMCHVLGAAYGLPHGVANSIMLPYALAFNYPVTQSEQEEFADEIRPLLQARGLPGDGSPAHLVAELQTAIGVPTTLEAAGVRREDLMSVARDVMQDRGLYFNPRRVSERQEILAVLENAWIGTI
jgi:alcohol dehydrogenase class IV